MYWNLMFKNFVRCNDMAKREVTPSSGSGNGPFRSDGRVLLPDSTRFSPGPPPAVLAWGRGFPHVVVDATVP